MLKNMVEAVETFHPIKGEKNRIEKGKSYGTSINFEDAPAVQWKVIPTTLREKYGMSKTSTVRQRSNIFTNKQDTKILVVT